jgi:two-component system cell cycle response regulator
MQVLVADDDPLTRHTVCEIVRTLGYPVLVAVDGLQAWEIIQAGEVSLLITDWQMPELDGPTLIRRIRATPFPHYIFCLLLTVRDQQADRIAGLDAGADDYLAKPVDPDELRARLAAAVRVLQLEQDLRAANMRLKAFTDQLQLFANQLQHQVAHDPLTGLLNRYGITRQATLELNRAEHTGQPLGIGMLDLDHFKQVNDQHGHVIGDLALRYVAGQLRHAVRPYDHVGRWGGEEFLLLLPGATTDTAYTIAERVRISIAEHALILPDQQQLSLRVSIGVTSTVTGTEHFEDLVELADQALYRAKATGRNRVCSAGGEHTLER